jgi:hypothetical protein
MRLGELGPSALALVRAVARFGPAVVHVQTEVVPGLDALVLGHISRRPGPPRTRPGGGGRRTP